MSVPPHLPLLALVPGDPEGIGPELAVKALCDPALAEVCRLRVVVDAPAFDATAAALKLAPCRLAVGEPADVLRGHHGHALLHLADAAAAGAAEPAALRAGRVALAQFQVALDLAVSQRVAGVCFMPFTKHSMRLADAAYVDEIEFIAGRYRAPSTPVEINVLDELWNVRVTSHIALRDVAAALNVQRIVERLAVADRMLRASGHAAPRIAVAALNPHASDGGNFGDEEARVIAPAIEQARAAGIDCDGPHAADTVFLRARKGGYAAVLTLYHDQGQIAMKLMGFERGVVLIAGFGFPITTPAHGSAHDIAGQGLADPAAAQAAVRLAAKLASRMAGVAT